jgi:hypothetical protein
MIGKLGATSLYLALLVLVAGAWPASAQIPFMSTSLKKGEVYKALNGKDSLRVVSKDEMEDEDGTVAKYTVEGDKVRVVATALGTTKAFYYKITKDGLVEEKSGKILYSEAARPAYFPVSPDGVITDTQTGLQWVVGPDSDTDYDTAEKWVAACNIAGGGWRMPTRQELESIYLPGEGERNMPVVFKTTGWFVWAEPFGSSSAWDFNFGYGNVYQNTRGYSSALRAFGVRSRPR